MKKLLNKSEHLVDEMCHGMIAAYPHLEFNDKYKFIKKKNIDENKVTLISGGGSGHEPAHAGYIGQGMLDVAVCGDVFASPSQIQVYKAIQASTTKKGTLLIIKNYSGDNINFKNAMNLARQDGIDIDYVIVDDDIAVKDSLYTVGRRGVAGTVFVHKIAGAAAAAGLSLAEVKMLALRTIANVKTLGFAFSSCTVPIKGTPTFELNDDEIEYGVGIHGEPGICRHKLKSAAELAEQITNALLEESKPENADTVVMVNGFGGTPMQELYVFSNSILHCFMDKGVKVVRLFVGNFMTSLEMAGASVTIFKLDTELKKYLFAAANTPGLSITGDETDISFIPYITHETQETEPIAVGISGHATIKNNELVLENIKYFVEQMAAVIIENEIFFCDLDSHAGDGDFGMSIANGFRQLKKEWKNIETNSNDIGEFLEECAFVIMENCGGASGPIWGAAFRAAGKSAKEKKVLSSKDMADMLCAAVRAIQEVGKNAFGRGAVIGDKTLIDALAPCADTWSRCALEHVSMNECFRRGAEAAVKGAEATKNIVARMGRAGAVGKRSIGYPDAGAYALGIIFTEIAKNV